MSALTSGSLSPIAPFNKRLPWNAGSYLVSFLSPADLASAEKASDMFKLYSKMAELDANFRKLDVSMDSYAQYISETMFGEDNAHAAHKANMSWMQVYETLKAEAKKAPRWFDYFDEDIEEFETLTIKSNQELPSQPPISMHFSQNNPQGVEADLEEDLYDTSLCDRVPSHGFAQPTTSSTRVSSFHMDMVMDFPRGRIL